VYEYRASPLPPSPPRRASDLVIDFDPRAEGAKEVLERFLVAMAPIMHTYWALGEDLGVRQGDIDEIIARRGLGSGLTAVDKLITDPEAAARPEERRVGKEGGRRAGRDDG